MEIVDGKMVESVPSGMSSLTFVFDRTGSMNDDLNQVGQLGSVDCRVHAALSSIVPGAARCQRHLRDGDEPAEEVHL